MQFISAIEVSTNRDAYFIVDIREPYEYELVNIQTVNIPMSEVCQRLNELPKDQSIVLMCQSGNRAAALGNLLAVDFALSNVLVLDGGINAWKEQVDHSLQID